METSTTYRWRPRVKVVVVDGFLRFGITASVIVCGVFAVFTEVMVRSVNRRAVAAMVREDAREMIATLQREGVWTLEFYGNVTLPNPYPDVVFYTDPIGAIAVPQSAGFVISVVDAKDGEETLEVTRNGVVQMRIDADGNLLLRGKLKEGVR